MVPASFIIKVIYWAALSCMLLVPLCALVSWAPHLGLLPMSLALGILFGRALYEKRRPVAPIRLRSVRMRTERHHPNERLH
jgi:hypothetical protein